MGEEEKEKSLALEYGGYKHQALLYSKLKNIPQKNAVKCKLCSHYCIIKDGDVGKCLVRKNEKGELFSLAWGKSTGLAIDPIEKKPFFHFKPGASTLSFGTQGCNFRCLNCQNWTLSQAVRENMPNALNIPPTTPKQIADAATQYHVDGIAYTYSEPTIFFEYARDAILECRKNNLTKNLFHVFVSNGYFTKEAFELVEKEKLLQAIRIDLKYMDDEKYWKNSSARLKPVMDSIKRVFNSKNKIHLEIINLLIPGENDSDENILQIANFVKSLSPDIPLHFSRFFPYYRMKDKPPTPESTLIKAKKIAEEIGMNYVYIGNTDLKGAEDTYCPNCSQLLISRSRFGVEKSIFKEKNISFPPCPKCGHKINIIL
ncbi:MAG: AmmeMemoRadiSam system radical SAM enzyme [Candidatus Micrarchaeota archaeon]